MNKQSGFTLIELVLVIVILGILAAVAVPKFVDLSGEAEQAAVESLAGALGSASVMNFAKEKATATTGTVVALCEDVGVLVEGGAVGAPASDYTLDNTAVGGAEGQSAVCTLTHTPSGKTADFRAINVDPT